MPVLLWPVCVPVILAYIAVRLWWESMTSRTQFPWRSQVIVSKQTWAAILSLNLTQPCSGKFHASLEQAQLYTIHVYNDEPFTKYMFLHKYVATCSKELSFMIVTLVRVTLTIKPVQKSLNVLSVSDAAACMFYFIHPRNSS